MSKQEFLSDGWMDEAKRIRAEYGADLAPPETTVKMNQIITEVPFGDGTIHAHIDTFW